MASNTNEYFSALYNRDVDYLRANAAQFDWRSTDNTWGTALVSFICGLADNPEPQGSLEDQDQVCEFLRWCIGQGADPEQHAPTSCGWEMFMPILRFRIGGQSALSLVSTFMELAEYHIEVERDDSMQHHLNFWFRLRESLKAPYNISRVNMLEGVHNTYQKIYEDKDSADVILVAKSGDSASQPSIIDFPAHSLVLQSSSSVFRAMLQHGTWTEGSSKKIEMDATPLALENFMSLIYTGSVAEAQVACEGVNAVRMLVETADLAHCYGMECISYALTMKLSGQVSSDSFETLACFAIRHKIGFLQRECVKFATEKKRSEDEASWKQWLGSLSLKAQGLIEELVDEQRMRRRRRLV